MNRQSMAVLQNRMHLPKIDKVIEKYCLELEEDEAFREAFIKKLPPNKERLTLLQLRCEIITAYLNNLSLGSYEQLKNAFTTYPRMHYRCLNWIKRNYRVLTKELDFTEEKIMKHYYLLHADANNLEALPKIESLGGMPFKTICERRPKILMSTYDTLQRIDELLIEHNIPFDSVQVYPEIYTLAAGTIEERLNEMNVIPEFKLMKTHPRVARLVYYYTKAKSRLEKYPELRAPSLNLLSLENKKFEKLKHRDIRIRGVDVVMYLSDSFRSNKKIIRDSLSRHPHWLNVPILQIQAVLNLLKSKGSFDDEQLIDAIPILLYPVEKVEKAMEEVQKSGEATPADPYFLHMVLYFMERPSHFTGDAVWPTKGHDDEEYGEGDDPEYEGVLRNTD